MSGPFLRDGDVSAFWNRVRGEADEEQQTGYLGDEWPQAISQARFRGEWKTVTRWLARWNVARGRVLDVGCGVGLWLESFAQAFDRADGIDISSAMVDSVRARMARRGVTNVEVACGSVTELPDTRRYDLVFVGGVLMYLDDEVVEPTLARLRRLLAPGGVLILRESTHRKQTWYRDKPLSPGLFADRTAPRPSYRAIYRPAELYPELLRRQGLVLRHHEPNRHYSRADVTEQLVAAANRFPFFGTLAKNRPRAEAVARWFDRLRWLTVAPIHGLIRLVHPGGLRLGNHWYVASAE